MINIAMQSTVRGIQMELEDSKTMYGEILMHCRDILEVFLELSWKDSLLNNSENLLEI